MTLSPLLPGYSSPEPDIQDMLDDMEARIAALEAANAGNGYRIDVTAPPYSAVADGSASSDSTTDNYDAFAAAIAFCKSNPGYELFVPAGEYDIYFNTDINDSTAGRHRYLLIDFGGLRITGTGIGKTVIRGKSHKTFRGRVSTLVGNTLTLVTAGDSANFRASMSIRISPNPDGSSARTINPGAISVLGPVCVSSVGAGTLTLYEGDRFSGVQANDYVFGDVGFALFQHEYTSSALTTPWNLWVTDVQLDAENYGAVVDPTGDANPILDCPTYCINSNPQPMTAGTSAFHVVHLHRVKCKGGYTQLHFGGGGANTLAQTELILTHCDVGLDAMSAVFMSTNDTFRGRVYRASRTYFHDLEGTMSSHLNYINPGVSLDLSHCRFAGWRASNFALQHWGTVHTSARFAHFVQCSFESTGAGIGVLTGEHSACTRFIACDFESYGGVSVRSSAKFEGCYFKPAYVSGTGIGTYGDCQYQAQIDIIDCGWNLVNVVGTGYTACVAVEHPVQVGIVDCWATAYDDDQSSSNDLVRGNTGPFLLVKDGSTGGLVTINGLRGKFATQSGAPVNVGWLMSATGADGAAIKMRNVDWLSRPASDRGQLQFQGRTTATDKIELVDCDITAAAGASIYTTTLPSSMISGRNNKFHGIGSVFGNRQNLRGREEFGPDIASGATIVWDPDYNAALITGTTTISTMNIVGPPSGGTSQLGYHGIVVTLHSPSGWSTDAAGNFFAAYTVAAGAALVVQYNAVSSKWVRVGS